MSQTQILAPLARVRFSRLVNGTRPLSDDDSRWLLSLVDTSSRKDLLRVIHGRGSLGHPLEFRDALVGRINETHGLAAGMLEFSFLRPELKASLPDDLFRSVWARIEMPTMVRIYPFEGTTPASPSQPTVKTPHGDRGLSCDEALRDARLATTGRQLEAVASCLTQHPRHGVEFLSILRTRFESGDLHALGLLAPALHEREWKSVGAQIVLTVLLKHDPDALGVVFWGRHAELERSEACQLAMHRAAIDGLLRALRVRLEAGETTLAERLLIALGHLELQPFHRRALHGFETLPTHLRPIRDVIADIASEREPLRWRDWALLEMMAAVYTHERLAAEAATPAESGAPARQHA